MQKSQYGRSMVEMLGVLAIIGVLSIVVVAGYRMAMSRHRANTISRYIAICSAFAQTASGSGNDDDLVIGECNGANLLDEAYPPGITRAAVAGTVPQTVVNITWADGHDSTKQAFIHRYSQATSVSPHINEDATSVSFFAIPDPETPDDDDDDD